MHLTKIYMFFIFAKTSLFKDDHWKCKCWVCHDDKKGLRICYYVQETKCNGAILSRHRPLTVHLTKTLPGCQSITGALQHPSGHWLHFKYRCRLAPVRFMTLPVPGWFLKSPVFWKSLTSHDGSFICDNSIMQKYWQLRLQGKDLNKGNSYKVKLYLYRAQLAS